MVQPAVATERAVCGARAGAPASTAMNRAPPCPSCGAPLAGAYCGACGESATRPEDGSARRFVTAAVAEATSLDSRLLRSFRLLLLRPGELTLQYLRGRRVVHLSPLQVFLLANLVYFFVQPLTGYTGYNTPLRSQVDRQFYSDPLGLEEVAAEAAAEAGLTPATYEAVYDVHSQTLARSLIILMVPGYALAVWLLFRRRNGVAALIFAMHFIAWELLVLDSLFLTFYSNFLDWLLSLPGQPLQRGLRALPRAAGVTIETLLTEMPTLLPTLAYLIPALRKVYGTGWLSTGVRAIALCFAQLLLVIAYRFVLFWATVLSL